MALTTAPVLAHATGELLLRHDHASTLKAYAQIDRLEKLLDEKNGYLGMLEELSTRCELLGHHAECATAERPVSTARSLAAAEREIVPSSAGGVASITNAAQSVKVPCRQTAIQTQHAETLSMIETLSRELQIWEDSKPSRSTESESCNAHQISCSCGNVFVPEAMFCRKCGSPRPQDESEDDFFDCVQVGESEAKALVAADEAAVELAEARQLLTAQVAELAQLRAGAALSSAAETAAVQAGEQLQSELTAAKNDHRNQLTAARETQKLLQKALAELAAAKSDHRKELAASMDMQKQLQSELAAVKRDQQAELAAAMERQSCLCAELATAKAELAAAVNPGSARVAEPVQSCQRKLAGAATAAATASEVHTISAVETRAMEDAERHAATLACMEERSAAALRAEQARTKEVAACAEELQAEVLSLRQAAARAREEQTVRSTAICDANDSTLAREASPLQPAAHLDRSLAAPMAGIEPRHLAPRPPSRGSENLLPHKLHHHKAGKSPQDAEVAKLAKQLPLAAEAIMQAGRRLADMQGRLDHCNCRQPERSAAACGRSASPRFTL